MRKTVTGIALAAAAAMLLTGCGSDGGSKGEASAADKAPSSQSASPKGATAEKGKHEVTLEVGGSGKVAVMYKAAGSGFEEQSLPWTLTETVELTAAEQRVGYLVTAVPGTITAADGSLQQAPCVIKVDGKKVADNDGGKNPKGCKFTIKG
ncbi:MULTISPECIES: hypothetical protein [unclassified Streptomyces]|uniref:hypothetical protein n=1 Tax=unclassified Streptomyces TaxID=2593676 RepID=UPI00081E1500|nr:MULTISPECIES: hypothetical protein [unclassified Streptomyces]MYR94062.1 hypothetical protein [Streptomyces sp. SID4937]SCD64528.1 hypothetical protein GA0115243_103791 [Streptomyces sp. ScaeMP-e83]